MCLFLPLLVNQPLINLCLPQLVHQLKRPQFLPGPKTLDFTAMVGNIPIVPLMTLRRLCSKLHLLVNQPLGLFGPWALLVNQPVEGLFLPLLVNQPVINLCLPQLGYQLKGPSFCLGWRP